MWGGLEPEMGSADGGGGAGWIASQCHIFQCFGEHFDSLLVEVQPVVEVPGPDGGVASQVYIGQCGAASGDLVVDVPDHVGGDIGTWQQGGDDHAGVRELAGGSLSRPPRCVGGVQAQAGQVVGASVQYDALWAPRRVPIQQLQGPGCVTAARRLYLLSWKLLLRVNVFPIRVHE